MRQTTTISADVLETLQSTYTEKRGTGITQKAMMQNGIHNTTVNQDARIAMNNVFSEEIETGKVTNQKQSGRCWLFAALNTFRHDISSRFQIKDFELSQNYMMFWDKLEQANYFLESMISTLDEPLDSRLNAWLLDTPQQDGGQWDMFVSLIEKYGIVPKQAMPETYQSSRTKELNAVLNAKLREGAMTLRKAHQAGKSTDELAQTKTDLLGDIYTVLTFTLGEPPKQFNFEYRDQKGDFHRDQDLTPHTFYDRYLGHQLHDYVSIINAPTEDKPFGKTFTVKYLGNVVGGKQIKYLNVDIDTLKTLAAKQLQDNKPVWFGCDVGQYSDRDGGVLDTALYDYETAFQTHIQFTKAERLDYKESIMTHAMALTGVNLTDGESNRWKVENSWGEKAGKDGYFVMSDDWMSEYTYQVVINKKYLTDDLIKAFEQEPIELEPWDPMGSLATLR